MRIAAALLACAALAACTSLPDTPTALPAGAHYVALGSSYAAGAGIPPLADDRPARCGASQRSYSRILASRLALTLTDVSCGGATTAHLLGPWDELPAQIDAVTADTRLVTVTIGGNDLNYMGVMFTASCHVGYGRERLADSQNGICPPLPVPPTEAYQALEDNLAAALLTIRERAPHARVVLVQYLALAPQDMCPQAPMLTEHFAAASNLARRLAEASARAARRAGVEVLPMDQLSQGHTACDPLPWTRGLGEGYDPALGAPWHPTAEGHAAIARELERLLAG